MGAEACSDRPQEGLVGTEFAEDSTPRLGMQISVRRVLTNLYNRSANSGLKSRA
jgi:hypothetical protein